MNQKTIIAAAAFAAIIIVASALALSMHQSGPQPGINATYNNGSSSAITTQNQTANSSKVLFSGTPYYPYSYLVYPGPISSQAKAALAGFSLNQSQLRNSSSKVTITVTGTSQQQTLVLAPGYRLYLIETTMGDDGFNFDSSFGDDGFVVVDQNGYVVQ